MYLFTSNALVLQQQAFQASSLGAAQN